MDMFLQGQVQILSVLLRHSYAFYVHQQNRANQNENRPNRPNQIKIDQIKPKLKRKSERGVPFSRQPSVPSLSQLFLDWPQPEAPPKK